MHTFTHRIHNAACSIVKSECDSWRDRYFMPFLLNVDREERVKTLLDGILPAFFTSYSNDAIILQFSVVRRNRKPIIKAIEAKTCNACYVCCTRIIPMYFLWVEETRLLLYFYVTSSFQYCSYNRILVNYFYFI